MQSEDFLIEKAKNLIENHLQWGDSTGWSNQDFLLLSEKIKEQTSIPLSHVTLKRIWGKVKYESLPNTHTLNTLVQFMGYENWLDFKIKEGNGKNEDWTVVPESVKTPATFDKKKWGIAAGLILLASALMYYFIPKTQKPIDAADYSFSSKIMVSQGVPNSVVFDYDATKAPFDSVYIQQSWDRRLRTLVSKQGHQHTCIYYFPDYYKAKLIVGNKIVKQHDLLIKSDGWLTAVETQPVPMYFDKKDALTNGKMSLPIEKIRAKNIQLLPKAPLVVYANVQDFGEIYSDDFTFETSVKNDYKEGVSVCQTTRIYILCENNAVWIPLCAKGCISDNDMLLTGQVISGKKEDLSAFGVDFQDFVKVKIVSKAGTMNVFINNVLAYHYEKEIDKAKIIGIDYTFEGTGSVDYVKLSNEKVRFEDNF